MSSRSRRRRKRSAFDAELIEDGQSASDPGGKLVAQLAVSDGGFKVAVCSVQVSERMVQAVFDYGLALAAVSSLDLVRAHITLLWSVLANLTNIPNIAKPKPISRIDHSNDDV